MMSLGTLQARKKLLEDINSTSIAGEAALRAVELEGLKNLREASEEEKNLTGLKNQQAINTQKMADIAREEANIRATMAQEAKDSGVPGKEPVPTAGQQTKLTELQSQKDLLTENNNLLREQAALEAKLVPFKKTTAEQQVQQQLLQAKQDSLIVDETSLQVLQETIKLEESRRTAAITRAGDRLGPFVDKEKFVAEEKYKLEKELLPKKLEAIEKEFEIKQKQIEIEYGLLEAKKLIQANELRILAETLRSQNRFPQAEKAESLASDIEAQNLEPSRQAALGMAEAVRASAISEAMAKVDDLRKAKDDLIDIKKLSDGASEALESGMVSAFDSIIQGTASVKDAFASMAVSVLQAISKIIAEMLVMRLLQSATGFFPSLFGSPTLGASTSASAVSADLSTKIKIGPQVSGQRYGGVTQPPPGYATGGIARGSDAGYPAILHGTEAVVPLPNNRSIPVDLKGAGQQNNVTVNVSIDQQGNASQDKQASSNQGANLGAAIASAVQRELQNQKRSGGILNPYGVA